MSDDPNPTSYELGHVAGGLYAVGHVGLTEREQQEVAFDAAEALQLGSRDTQHYVRGWLQGYREASKSL
jgi:hypothetical protein